MQILNYQLFTDLKIIVYLILIPYTIIALSIKVKFCRINPKTNVSLIKFAYFLANL